MPYVIRKVDRFPDQLESEVVYLSEMYEMAALLCPSGCGHRINLLVGDGHQVVSDGGLADIEPSIGVWDAPCRSHFWIKKGRLLWAGDWSEERIKRAMLAQQSRHIEAGRIPQSLAQRVWKWLREFLFG